MSKHHRRDYCGEQRHHREHCKSPAYGVYPVGGAPFANPAPNSCFMAPPQGPEMMQAAQEPGGSCFMTPQGPVCPSQGGGGCFMTPQGPVCPSQGGGGSCFMGPQGPVCPSMRQPGRY